jgi:hypothetical protein
LELAIRLRSASACTQLLRTIPLDSCATNAIGLLLSWIPQPWARADWSAANDAARDTLRVLLDAGLEVDASLHRELPYWGLATLKEHQHRVRNAVLAPTEVRGCLLPALWQIILGDYLALGRAGEARFGSNRACRKKLQPRRRRHKTRGQGGVAAPL